MAEEHSAGNDWVEVLPFQDDAECQEMLAQATFPREAKLHARNLNTEYDHEV